MAHLSPSFGGAAAIQPPRPPKPPGPPGVGQSINSCRNSALVVENDPSLTKYFLRVLKDKGYATRTAGDAEEGLRLFQECGPFSVVFVNYCLSNGMQLALTIREVNPSQTMIIPAFDYRAEDEVDRPPALEDAALLLDTRNFRLRCLLDEVEVKRAIEELSKTDLLRLRKFADFRVQGLPAAYGMTGEDLIAEALRRTLEGTRQNGQGRHWNRDVDFITHLTRTMQSIASGCRRKSRHILLECDALVCDIEGRTTSPLDNTPSNDPPPDERLIEMQEESRIIERFANDTHATWVVRGFFDNLKKIEIMQRYGLTEKQYTAAVKRIRLKLYGRTKE